MPATATAEPIHPATLAHGVETMISTQDAVFRLVRKITVTLRTDPIGSQINAPFAQLVELLAQQTETTALFARALAQPTEASEPAKPEPVRDVVAESASMRKLDDLARTLTLA